MKYITKRINFDFTKLISVAESKKIALNVSKTEIVIFWSQRK